MQRESKGAHRKRTQAVERRRTSEFRAQGAMWTIQRLVSIQRLVWPWLGASTLFPLWQKHTRPLLATDCPSPLEIPTQLPAVHSPMVATPWAPLLDLAQPYLPTLPASRLILTPHMPTFICFSAPVLDKNDSRTLIF